MSHSPHPPEKWLRYMPAVQHQRQELRLVENAWDHLALLSSLSLLSAKASAGGDLARARQDFAALSAELMRGLATEALKNRVEDLGSRAQVCIDVLVRNLFERTADIGFFATDVVVANYLGRPQSDGRSHVEGRLREYASKYSVYSNIFLFDAQGQLCASLKPVGEPVTGTAAVDQAFLRMVMDSTLPYVEHYAVHGFSGVGTPTLMYAQRVASAGQPVGVLCLEFDLRHEMPTLFASIQGDASEGDTDVVLALTDVQGRVMVSSDPLQFPADERLPCAGAAGVHTLKHMSRHYLAVVRDTQGFQGYQGPGWRGVALLPMDMAFDETHAQEGQALMAELRGQVDFLSDDLRDIPSRSTAIQGALERSVWNGLLELNRLGDHEANVTERDLLFAKTLLSEIGTTARKTAQAFAGALQDLYGVVSRSLIRDAQSRAALVMQILDRNLYERANDCRWWALTPQFASTLIAGEQGCKRATDVLTEINQLYSVYSCLVLFDRQGRVMAVSNSGLSDQVGTLLDEPWIGACLRLQSSQDYTVSAYAPSRFYAQGPTFVYAAAVRDPSRAEGPVLGGIAVVWDAAHQIRSILSDCATGTGADDVLALVDAQDGIVQACGNAVVLESREAIGACRTEGPMVDLESHLYGVGVARGQGYREFRARDGYDHGLSCLALRHLCERKPAAAAALQLAHGMPRVEESYRMQMATFTLGNHWLGIEAAQVVMAAPDATVLGAGSTRALFPGFAQIGHKVYPVVDLRAVLVADAVPSRVADPNRQLVVVCVTLQDGAPREFALRVDALGAIVDLDRRQLQVVGMAGLTLVDAVASVATAGSGAGQGTLCRISSQWLQQCAVGALQDTLPQDLGALGKVP